MRIAALSVAVVLAGCAATQPVGVVTPSPEVAGVAAGRPVIAQPPAPSPPVQALPQAQKSPPAPARPVLVVIDGDTVDVAGVRWRLKGFDAPEITSARCSEERALGLKAKARLEAILSTGQIETITDHKREHFGRTLGTIKANGRDVGEILVAEGLAVRLSGARKHNWCPSLPPKVMVRAPGKSPCAGLLEAACKRPTCLWVKHASPTDKHGRPVKDYCRLAGKA